MIPSPAQVPPTGDSQSVCLSETSAGWGDQLQSRQSEKELEADRRRRIEALIAQIKAEPLQAEFLLPRDDAWALSPFEEDECPAAGLTDTRCPGAQA